MTQRRYPQKIGSIVENFLSEYGYLTACKEQDVARQWPEIVGERVAAVSVCQRTERGVLYVRVTSAAWRHELVYMKGEILARVHQRCDSIVDIVFS
jgi:predicted nucleic acid-binding Zn ribbon protein